MTALLPHEREKARRVGAMFDGIAPRYDVMNRLMSAGQDQRWRRLAVAALSPLPPGPLLDIGAGTGDLALALRRRHPRRTVVGVDLSGGMLSVAHAKSAELRLARADTLRLPLADRVFAAAATAFTLRNVADLGAALHEIRRTLQPGAPFACLEITRPESGPLARLFALYFHGIVPRVGALVSGRAGAYRYLPESVDRFVTGRGLASAITAAGFREVQFRRFWPGPVTLHTARA